MCNKTKNSGTSIPSGGSEATKRKIQAACKTGEDAAGNGGFRMLQGSSRMGVSVPTGRTKREGSKPEEITSL